MSVQSPMVDIDLHDRGYSVWRGRSRGTFPQGHRHQGLEIFFLHAGTSQFTIDDQSYVLRAGSAIVFAGETVHVSRPVEHRYTRTALHLDPDIVAGPTRREMAPTCREKGEVYALRPDSVARFAWATRELASLVSGRQAGRRTVECLLQLVLTGVLTGQRSDPSSPAIVWEMIDYMQANFARQESLDNLYTRFHYSPGHLRHLFKDAMGCSPQRYWLRLKIDRACELLCTASTVEAVAAASGFASTRTFQRAFKREMGISPAEYRVGTGRGAAPVPAGGARR